VKYRCIAKLIIYAMTDSHGDYLNVIQKYEQTNQPSCYQVIATEGACSLCPVIQT